MAQSISSAAVGGKMTVGGAAAVPTREPQGFFTREGGMTGTNGLFWMGLVFACLGGLMLLIKPVGGIQIGGGVLLMVTSHWAKTNPLFRLHSDHLEMKVAIAAPRHLVLFSDITQLTRVSTKKATLATRQGKTITLPLAALEPEDAAILLDGLEAQIRS
jgi:hypothetical protein